MTDSKPEVVATADLTPESPNPIHLSSPVLVPTLQDQADFLSNMDPLTSTGPVGADPGAAAGPVDVPQLPNGAAGDLAAAPAAAGAAAASAAPDGSYEVTGPHTGAEAQTAPPVADDHADEYAKAFDSPPAHQDALHDDEPNPADATAAYDPAKAMSHLDSTFAPEPLSSATAAPSTEGPAASAVPELVTHAAPDATSWSDPASYPAQIPVPAATVVSAPPTEAPQPEDGIDIQALVDKITAASEATQAAPAAPENSPGPSATPNPQPSQPSLPPKPPASQQPSPADLRAEELRRFQPNPAAPSVPTTVPFAYPPPGAVPDATAATAYAPTAHAHANPGAASLPVAPSYGATQMPPADVPQRYDDFLKEERKYVSEAKWDRFPEGSRLFIGNLSSERVAKKEVFEIFSRYGRLAQISLKQAYGFVQYHTVAEGQAAMENLQGIEIRGRKIHLEFSRMQKKDGDGGDKRGSRGGRGGGSQADRDRDRFDSRRRDGYRPRSPSPSRGHHRNDSYGRERGHWEPPSDYSSRRGRSRSPGPYGSGSGSGGYRRRSPSPYRRGPPVSEVDLDIPRRYGAEVPDVQLLLLQEVNRDFVSWVQGAFLERGLKVDVMFLNPRFPRELVIQRQVVEGVFAVSELDYRAQSMAKIPLQTFDRSAGRHNARFDQYQDLEPKIAAEIVARTKAQTQLHSPAGYGNGQYPPVSYPPAPQHHHPHQPQPYPGQPAANINLGGLDNATLQKVLSAIQAAPPGGAPAQHMGGAPGVDVNAVLSALGSNPGGGVPQQHQQPVSYPQHPSMPGAPPASAADQAHVQNIMAQLSRYRQ